MFGSDFYIYLAAGIAVAVVVLIVAIVAVKRHKPKKAKLQNGNGAGADEHAAAKNALANKTGSDVLSGVGRVDGEVVGETAGAEGAGAKLQDGTQSGAQDGLQTSFDDVDALLNEPSALLDAHAKRFAYNSEVHYTAINVDEPCGFDFANVVEGQRAGNTSDTSNASVSTSSSEKTSKTTRKPRLHTVYASGVNFEKIKSDLDGLSALFELISGENAEKLYKAACPDCKEMAGLLRPFGSKDDKTHGMENLGVISVYSSGGAHTEDARAELPKYPVSVRIITVLRDAGESKESQGTTPVLDSLVVDLHYEPDGIVHAGKIVRWHGRQGYLCDFEWNAFDQSYHPNLIKISNTPGKWETTFAR